MSDPIKCPECIQGKHGNCDGDAYDFATESTVPCDCQCIGDSYKAASHASPAPADVQPGDRAGEAQDGRTTAEWISDLVKARQAAESEVERLHETLWPDDMFRRTLDRAEAAEAAVARVDELAGALITEAAAEHACYRIYDGCETCESGDVAVKFRTALADPEPAQVQQANYSEVWSNAVAPGGYICSVCGFPVESEPCPEHAPTTPTETKD